MGPFLSGPEVHEAFDLGIEELLPATAQADPDDLLNAGHADARQTHVGLGAACLNVGGGTFDPAAEGRHRSSQDSDGKGQLFLEFRCSVNTGPGSCLDGTVGTQEWT
ncbi:MAG: hypothetical protein NVSMB25_05500 [Thermoleophilaceae bacterium]